MPEVVYQQADFVASGGIIACDSLAAEIAAALPSPAPQLDAFPTIELQNSGGPPVAGIVAVLSFDAALTGPQQTTLDGVIAAHLGIALNQLPAVGATGYSIPPPAVPIVVPIVAIGAFVFPLPGPFAVSALTPNLSSPAPGVLRYNGVDATLALRASVPVASVVGAVDVSVAFFQNGLLVPNSNLTGPGFVGIFVPVVTFATVDATDGDEFTVGISNLTAVSNLNLRGVRFGIEG